MGNLSKYVFRVAVHQSANIKNENQYARNAAGPNFVFMADENIPARTVVVQGFVNTTNKSVSAIYVEVHRFVSMVNGIRFVRNVEDLPSVLMVGTNICARTAVVREYANTKSTRDFAKTVEAQGYVNTANTSQDAKNAFLSNE
jgi:hypothetical protein